MKKKRNETVRFARRFAYDESAINLLLYLSFSFIQLTINQTTIAESIKTSSLFKKNSSSNSINKKKNVFADLPNEIKHLDVFMSAFNDIMTAVEFEKMILNKLNKKIKVEKSTTKSMSNRKARTFVTSLDEAFLSLIQKSNFDWISFFDITKSNNNNSSKFNFFLRASKRKRL